MREGHLRPVAGQVRVVREEGGQVKTLQLKTIIKELGQGQPILIETPAKVQVVGFDEVWLLNPAAHPETTTLTSRSGCLPANRPCRRPSSAS